MQRKKPYEMLHSHLLSLFRSNFTGDVLKGADWGRSILKDNFLFFYSVNEQTS